uniref:Uncharacterized protein n=1 Tax=Wuchereria bancrofti TaxID=6293 RepID=A0A1I8E9W5_WUCBA
MYLTVIDEQLIYACGYCWKVFTITYFSYISVSKGQNVNELHSDGILLPGSFIERFQLPLSNHVDDVDEKSVKRHCITLLLRTFTIFADDSKVCFSIFCEVDRKLIFQGCTTNSSCFYSFHRTSGNHSGILSFDTPLFIIDAVSMQIIAALSNLCVDFTTQNNFLSSLIRNSEDYLQDFPKRYSISDFFWFSLLFHAQSSKAFFLFFPALILRLQFRAQLSTLEGIVAQTQSIPLLFSRLHCFPTDFTNNIFISKVILFWFKRLNSLYDPKNASVIHMSQDPVFEITNSE